MRRYTFAFASRVLPLLAVCFFGTSEVAAQFATPQASTQTIQNSLPTTQKNSAVQSNITGGSITRGNDSRTQTTRNNAARNDTRSNPTTNLRNGRAVRYDPRYGYMVGDYRIPNYSRYQNYAVPYNYGYSAPYRSSTYRYGTSYLGPTYYPGYRYPTRVRVYRQPATSSTFGGAHSSQYFGQPHSSQYFPR